jgi:hypothetical protein
VVDPTRKLVPQLINTAARETYPVRIALDRGELVAYGHDGVRHVIPRGGRDGARFAEFLANRAPAAVDIAIHVNAALRC